MRKTKEDIGKMRRESLAAVYTHTLIVLMNK